MLICSPISVTVFWVNCGSPATVTANLQTLPMKNSLKRSTDAIARLSPLTSCMNWSDPSRSLTIPTSTAERSWQWKSACQRSECRCVLTSAFYNQIPISGNKLVLIAYVPAISQCMHLSRFGSRIAEPNGGDRRKWMPAPWSSTTRPCSHSTARPCTPTRGPWTTRCPLTLGWPPRCPVPLKCTTLQDSWVPHKDYRQGILTTVSWALPKRCLRACSLCHPHRTNAPLLSLTNIHWRTWNIAVPALLLWGWKLRNTSTPWTRPGNQCVEKIECSFKTFKFLGY